MKVTKKAYANEDMDEASMIEVADEDRFRRAGVKFDGCIHYEEYQDDKREEYLHICDLPGQIEFLQKVLKAGKEHFGEQWP